MFIFNKCWYLTRRETWLLTLILMLMHMREHYRGDAMQRSLTWHSCWIVGILKKWSRCLSSVRSEKIWSSIWEIILKWMFFPRWKMPSLASSLSLKRWRDEIERERSRKLTKNFRRRFQEMNLQETLYERRPCLLSILNLLMMNSYLLIRMNSVLNLLWLKITRRPLPQNNLVRITLDQLVRQSINRLGVVNDQIGKSQLRICLTHRWSQLLSQLELVVDLNWVVVKKVSMLKKMTVRHQVIFRRQWRESLKVNIETLYSCIWRLHHLLSF